MPVLVSGSTLWSVFRLGVVLVLVVISVSLSTLVPISTSAPQFEGALVLLVGTESVLYWLLDAIHVEIASVEEP